MHQYQTQYHYPVIETIITYIMCIYYYLVIKCMHLYWRPTTNKMVIRALTVLLVCSCRCAHTHTICGFPVLWLHQSVF